MKRFPSLLHALEREWKYAGVPPRICAAGAGGKTTVIKELAWELVQAGSRVVVTTTTRMYAEEYPWFLMEDSREKMEKILERERAVFLGRPVAGGKMGAPDPSWMERIQSMPYPVLTEADGARRLPLKVPGEHEPVYPENTACVLYVCGMQAVGRPCREVCFRPERAAAILGKHVEDRLDENDIARLILHREGGRKGIRDDMAFAVILNQADRGQDIQAAAQICRILEEQGKTVGIIRGREEKDEDID